MTQDNGMDTSPSWQEAMDQRDIALINATFWETRARALEEAGNGLYHQLGFWSGSERHPDTQRAKDNWAFLIEEPTEEFASLKAELQLAQANAELWEEECKEARANDRQAMAYLEEIRQIVGKNLDFPGVIKTLRRRNDAELDQLALDTAQSIFAIEYTNLPGERTQALAKAQCRIRDALERARS